MRFVYRDHDETRLFTRRSIIVGASATTLMGLIAARLYKLQVIEEAHYRQLSEENRVSRRLIAPVRGLILDRFGRELALNNQNFRVVIIPEQTVDDRGRTQVAATLDRLAKVIPLPDHIRERVLREARTQPRFRPILVAEGLTWDEFARVNILVPDLSGIQPEIGERRDYPYGSDMSHVLGYVGRVSDKDIEALRRAARRHGHNLNPELEETLHLPSFRIGKSGIEYAEESALRGTSGARHVEVNAFGREIKELSKKDGTPGKNVVLTIDAELQSYIMSRVAGKSAAVVVMDISNGEILALASAPGFDPNPFTIGLTTKEWKALQDNQLNPLLNKTISGLYPPGSTFKIVTALAGLSSGAVTPETTYFCGGSMRFGNHVFHCWKKSGHGLMNMHLGIKNSCDIYFYNVAHAAGIDNIAKAAHKMGLGSNYDFVIPGAKSGIVPSKAWKRSTLGKPWYQGETLSVGIGQGYVTVSPLQLAVMVSRLANGGKAIVPTLVRDVGEDTHTEPAPGNIGIPDSELAVVRSGMNGVSNEPGGTAYRSRIKVPGMELCGKTGTAQVRNITAAERRHGVIKNEDLPWKLRDHALFVAFAPRDEPRYAISVVVEHGEGGSKAAAPIGRDVLLFAQQRDPLRRVSYDPRRAAYYAARTGPTEVEE
jgi:penicillin-binding protein 2